MEEYKMMPAADLRAPALGTTLDKEEPIAKAQTLPAMLPVATSQDSEEVVTSEGAIPTEPLPARIGRYVILHRLGAGGMGVVYAAYDPDLERKVALKVVRNNKHQASAGRARIVREAQAMAQVSHSNVVHVYEVGQDQSQRNGPVFIAMELVDGVSMVEWQRRNPSHSAASIQARLRLYLQAAQGLLAAHRLGIVHRDFKPDNVLVGDDGRVRVVDFGLARALQGDRTGATTTGTEAVAAAGAELGADKTASGLSPRITAFGSILGTPGYMSPEQARGEPADARSDQFSFCIALYEALYQQLPFPGETFDSFAKNLFAGKPVPLPPPPREVPIVVEEALLRGLSLDPAARFPSMQELIDALQAGLGPNSETESVRAAGRRLRRLNLLIVGMIVPITSLLGLRITAETMAPEVAIGAVLVATTAVISFLFRRATESHPRYRRLRFLIAVLSVYTLMGRVAGYLAGLTRSQYISVELIGLAALLFISAPQISQRYVWVAATACAASLLMLIFPAARPFVISFFYPAFALATLTLALRNPSPDGD